MLIFAHRGASGEAPENTISAFSKALEQGAEAIELDIHLTRDGELVVCHDHTINRTSNGKGFICNYTLNEMRQYDFGSWFSSEYIGEQIPTLEEVLQLLQGTTVTLNIEIKNGLVVYDGIEEKLLSLLNQYRFLDQAIVSSFDHQCLNRIHTMKNAIRTSYILSQNLVNVMGYFEYNQLQPYSIQPNYYIVTQELISEAHERSIKVFPYTINDIKLGEKIQKLAVDGIITDFPNFFRQLV